MSAIDEIKQRLDIVDIIGDYVQLQKAGRNLKALCPFHSEKHASFYVFPEKQTWHCFGACGTGGDIFSFIMKKENIGFSETLQLLANRAGVSLDSGRENRVDSDKKNRLFQINEMACEHYHHLLLNSDAAEKAREYLKTRKINQETIKEFRLGYSPDSWDYLKNALTGKNYQELELQEAGLLIETEKGVSYDRFRNQIMFPIMDIKGNITGFGARTLGDALPKYVNSPQTMIFDKSSSIYAVHKATPFIREKGKLIIVEGYMDVLTAYQHGWRNTVAAMGTSLTENQVSLARKLSANIALAFDADRAGIEATLRSAEVIARILDKTDVSVIAMPPGKDPDDLISEDPELWQQLVSEALPVLDFSFNVVLKDINTNARGKSNAVSRLLPIIGSVKDPIQRAHYQRKLALTLDIDESGVKDALNTWSTSRSRGSVYIRKKRATVPTKLKQSPCENYCLALLLNDPDLISTTDELSEDYFENTDNHELFIQWLQHRNGDELRQCLDSALIEHLEQLLKQKIIESTHEKRQDAFIDCVLNLRNNMLKRNEQKKELMYESTREQEGIAAELAKLEEQGTANHEELKTIQSKRIEIRRGKNNGLN